MNTQIAAATEEQSAVADEVSRNIEKINQLSAETAQTADLTEQSSNKLSQDAVQLREMIKQFGEDL